MSASAEARLIAKYFGQLSQGGRKLLQSEALAMTTRSSQADPFTRAIGKKMGPMGSSSAHSASSSAATRHVGSS